MSVADRYLRTLENQQDPQSPTKENLMSPFRSPKKAASVTQGQSQSSPVRSAVNSSPWSQQMRSPERSPVKSTLHASPTRSPTRSTPLRSPEKQPPKQSPSGTHRTPQRSPLRTSVPVITPTQNKERKKLLVAENGASLDQERKNLQAYEYLCHVGEAHQWMAGILGSEEMPKNVVDLPEALVDGVLLAKIARHFRPELVPKIFEHPRLQYRHTDNIVYFFDFLTSVKMPDLFTFDMVDLYEKRSLPKVIFCIHALSHILNEIDLAPEMNDLVGKLEFSDDQLSTAQKGLDAAGIAPQFNKVQRHFSGQRDPLPPVEEPQEEPEEEAEPVTPVRMKQPVFEPESPQVSLHISEEELQIIELEAQEPQIVLFQAQCRGALIRRMMRPKVGADEFVVRLQSLARGWRMRCDLKAQIASIDTKAIVTLQSVARASASRQRGALNFDGDSVVALQSLIRGKAARKAHTYTLEVAPLQGLCRGALARKRMAALDARIASHSKLIVQLQQISRAYLARRGFEQQRTRVSQASWTGLQANIRGVLLRRRLAAQRAQLEACSSSILQVQSAFRGLLQRFQVGCQIDDLDDEIVGIVGMQSMARGYLQRKRFIEQVAMWHAHTPSIIKLQSMWRTKTQIEAYNSLIADPNPSLGTIKHFVHLLNDNEADYQEEINLEIARKDLKDAVKSNEQLEQYIAQMDTKIALLLKNKISLDEVIQHRNDTPTLLRRKSSARLRIQQQQSLERNGHDLKALNKNSRKRLELYQGLFYILQTQPQYLSRFIDHESYEKNPNEREQKRFIDLILTVFGNLSEDREEYFFLQLLSKSIYLDMEHMETQASSSSSLVWRLYSAMSRRRSVQKSLNATVGPALERIIDTPSGDLECDPLKIHYALNGDHAYEVTVEDAIREPNTRSKFVSNLQLLRELVVEIMAALEAGIAKMPYHARYLAHQAYMYGCRKYDNYVGFNSMSLVGTVFISHFIVPAMLNCDQRGVLDVTLDISQQRNLVLVCKVLNTAAHFGEFEANEPYLQPLNDFVRQCSDRLGVLFKKVIDVPDLQTMYGITNFDDVKSHQRPSLSIKTEDILAVHSLVFENMDVVCDSSDNCVRPVLRQLGPLPSDSRDLLDIARLAQVRLELNPNYGTPSMQASNTDAAGLMTLVKRCLIYVLRVQKGENLMSVLIEPVYDQQEQMYARILEEDQSSVGAKKPGELANLTYRELKLLTLEKVLELESSGRISRDNHYQELINSLANDIRNKHELRQARVSELRTCTDTLASLKDKEKHLKISHKTFEDYIETAMTTLQEQSQERNRNKRSIFSRKLFHREVKQSKFGSFRYTAAQAQDKGILLQVRGYSDRQYRDLSVTFSCEKVANFTVEIAFKGILLPGASTSLTLDELLEYQYEDKESFTLFDGAATFHTTRLLQFIFRKFYGAAE